MTSGWPTFGSEEISPVLSDIAGSSTHVPEAGPLSLVLLAMTLDPANNSMVHPPEVISSRVPTATVRV